MSAIISLNNYSLYDLRQIAKWYNIHAKIRNFSKKKKDDLIEELNKYLEINKQGEIIFKRLKTNLQTFQKRKNYNKNKKEPKPKKEKNKTTYTIEDVEENPTLVIQPSQPQQRESIIRQATIIEPTIEEPEELESEEINKIKSYINTNNISIEPFLLYSKLNNREQQLYHDLIISISNKINNNLITLIKHSLEKGEKLRNEIINNNIKIQEKIDKEIIIKHRKKEDKLKQTEVVNSYSNFLENNNKNLLKLQNTLKEIGQIYFISARS
jgi:hypothetical protein